jgi:hypothetical protein
MLLSSYTWSRSAAAVAASERFCSDSAASSASSLSVMALVLSRHLVAARRLRALDSGTESRRPPAPPGFLPKKAGWWWAGSDAGAGAAEEEEESALFLALRRPAVAEEVGLDDEGRGAFAREDRVFGREADCLPTLTAVETEEKVEPGGCVDKVGVEVKDTVVLGDGERPSEPITVWAGDRR